MRNNSKFKFTKSRLTDLDMASHRDRYFVNDSIVRRFCLMDTKMGYKSFYVDRTINSRLL